MGPAELFAFDSLAVVSRVEPVEFGPGSLFSAGGS